MATAEVAPLPAALESASLQARALWLVDHLAKLERISAATATSVKRRLLVPASAAAAGASPLLGAFELYFVLGGGEENAPTLVEALLIATEDTAATISSRRSAFEDGDDDDEEGAAASHAADAPAAAAGAGAAAAVPAAQAAAGSTGGRAASSSSGGASTGASAVAESPVWRTGHDDPKHIREVSVSVDEDVTLLYCAKDMEPIAAEAAALSGGRIVLGEIAWSTFRDGFPNLFIKGVKAVRNHRTAFLASFHSTSTIFEQMAAVYALPRYLAREFHVVLPYYPTGTMERVDRLGEVATANTLSRILSGIPQACLGQSKLCIFDIHTLSQRFYFDDTVHVRLKSCTHMMRDLLHKEYADDDVCIVFPDEGAYKRFRSKFPGFPTALCQKVRDGDERRVVITEGKEAVVGNHAVIIDDLVQTGGTLLACVSALNEVGARRISCYVTHAVFPEESWRKFAGNKLIYRFWVTNSIPTTARVVHGVAPFEVLSIAPVVNAVLLGTRTSPPAF